MHKRLTRRLLATLLSGACLLLTAYASPASESPSSQPIQQTINVTTNQQQQHLLINSNNNNKKQQSGAHQAWQMANLQKFQKYLSEHQQELMRSNPGSLWAVARAIKMTIKECQYQMRHEPWDCPIHGFSVRPVETFGLLMSRSTKETSFIQSLLSSAIAHSVARACTESIITTCSRKQLPHGNGFGENIEFGLEFARNFTEVTHELQQQQQQMQRRQVAEFTQQKSTSGHSASSQSGNLIDSPASLSSYQLKVTSGQQQSKYQQQQQQQQHGEPIWKEKRLRQMINVHNDEVGHLIVLNNMRRECKCHGISGACTLQTCWDKLPTFREVANRLHDSLDKALRVEMYVAPQGSSLANARHKSLTSTAAGASSMIKKSNKKRSSSLQAANLLSGLGRSSTSTIPTTLQFTKSPLMGAGGGGVDTSMDSGGGVGEIESGGGSVGGTSVRSAVGRLQASHQELNSISNNNIGSHGSIGGGGGGGGGTGGNVNEIISASGGGIDKQSSSEFAQNTIQYSFQSSTSATHTSQSQINNSNNNTTSSPVKKRPIARSIGLTASTITPGRLDLLYFEESPDFCIPNERYNIKGTKGRVCSENQLAPNSCETLCCGRGYKTEIREEKYTCECKFQYCCNLKCKTCTRRKVIHKCL